MPEWRRAPSATPPAGVSRPRPPNAANACAVATGACCDETTGLCTDDVSEGDCGEGRWGGDGSTCATLDPVCAIVTTGACCVAHACIDDIDEVTCEQQGGIYQGAGSECATTTCPEPATVIISEIMYNPASTEGGSPDYWQQVEWVEIYNYGTSAVDISGWGLMDEDNDWGIATGVLPSSSIAAGEAVVLIPGPDAIGSNPGTTVAEFQASWGSGYQIFLLAQWSDNLQSLSNSPSDTNEILTLVNASGIAVDVANYDDGYGSPANDWPNPYPGGPSVYLNCDSLDGVSNDAGANWSVSTNGVEGAFENTSIAPFDATDTGSPGYVYECTGITGACCDRVLYTCTDGLLLSECTGEDEEWTGGALCAELDPPCVEPTVGACCFAGFCGEAWDATDCATAGGVYQGDATDCAGVTCPAGPAIEINEIRIDQDGTDNDEYFELYGDASASLDGLTYIVIGDGSGSGTIEAVVDLTGLSLNASGYFLAAEDTFSLTGTPDLVTSLNFENSDNVTHVLVAGFTGANGDDLDVDDDGTLDSTPWAGQVDLIAVIEEANPPLSTAYHYGPPLVGPDGSYAPSHVYRCSNDTTSWGMGEYDATAGSDTPGAPNGTCILDPEGACCDETTGVCTDNVTEAECDGLGNRYGGDESTCLDIDPPCTIVGFGACCVGETCVDDVSSTVCDAMGGIYQGDDSECASVTCPTAPSVIISEIMYNPNSSEGTSPDYINKVEWVEIYNNGASAVDISGWKLADEDTADAWLATDGIPASSSIAPGEAVILCPGADTVGANPGVTVAEFQAAWGSGYQIFPLANWGDNLQSLSNSPALDNEMLVLLDGSDNAVDLVNFSDSYPDADGWPNIYNLGQSIYLECFALDSLSNDVGDNWAASTYGVEGATNNTVTTVFDGVDTGSPGYVFDCTGLTGACCDTSTYTCTDGVSAVACSGADMNWTASTLCADLDPPCVAPVEGACCYAGYCVDAVFETECEANGGTFQGDGVACGTVTCPAGPSEVLINEIRIDHYGADTEEYFELIGTPSDALDGLFYLVIGDGSPGDSGVIENVTPLTGGVIDANGFFVVATSAFTIGTADMTAALTFENSDNVTHLLVAGFYGNLDDDLDTDDDGTLDSTPWAHQFDLVGIVETDPPAGTEDEYQYGPPSVGPDGSYAPGHVYRCVEEPTTWGIGLYDVADEDASDTPGAANDDCLGDPTGACCDEYDGTCTDDVTEYDCTIGDNRWGGEGSTCLDIDPPCVAIDTGACCLAGSCVDEMFESECELRGGIYQGTGVDCLTVTCPSVPSVIVTEIMYDPNSDEGTSPDYINLVEWIEIYNNGASAVDISGWSILDEDPYDATGDLWWQTGPIPASSTIAPGEAVVLAVGPDTEPQDNPSPGVSVADFQAAWGTGYQIFPLDDWNDNLHSLANSPAIGNEIVTLIDASGLAVDVVDISDSYPDPDGWPNVYNTGKSIYLECYALDATSNDDGNNWGASEDGTDGAFANTETLIFAGPDTGSPGYVYDCAGVTGACCDRAALTCTDDVAAIDCAGEDMEWTGSTLCADLDPPCAQEAGACCYFGFCADGVGQVDCETDGGVFQGAGVECVAVTCPTAPSVAINEIRIDQASADNDEYFELLGDPSASLDGLTYLVLGDAGAGDSGVIEAVVSLTGQSLDANGFLVAAEDTFTLMSPGTFFETNVDFENGDNVTHILVAGFAGADNDDLDTDDDGTLDVTPWAGQVDLIALVEEENPPTGTEYHYGPPSVGPDGSFVPGHAHVCDGAWTIGEYDLGVLDTPGADNNCPVCGNGTIEYGEECDDNNTDDEDGCSSTCQDEYCGDGVTQGGLGETCDDGNTIAGDGCDEFCQSEGGTACVDHVDCVLANNNCCEWDNCGGVTAGFCDPVVPNMFGDVCGADFPEPPNGAVNLTDVLCTLNAFGLGNLGNCPNADVVIVSEPECPGGNGVVNLTDILKVLDAFGAPSSPTASFFCVCPENP